PVAPQAIAPSEDSAVVVFMRPSYRGGTVAILDEHGRFLGESVGHSHFAVKVSPGDHTFVGCAQNTAALRASLAGGKTYFVEVAPRMGCFGNRVQLLAITPRAETWNHRESWLGDTKQLVTDDALASEYVKDHGDETAERLQRATQILGEYDAKELDER